MNPTLFNTVENNIVPEKVSQVSGRKEKVHLPEQLQNPKCF